MEPRDVTGTVSADAYETDMLAAISGVTDPDEAEHLIKIATIAEEAVRLQKLGTDRQRRWAVVRLRAERKYGELLPPAESGNKTSRPRTANPSREGVSSKADENARRQARKVWAIGEPAFEDYVSNSTSPSRAGLLRGTSAPRGRRTYTDAEIETLRKEIRRRLKAGKPTDFRELMARFDMGQGKVQSEISYVKGELDAGQIPKSGKMLPPNWNGISNSQRQRELTRMMKERGTYDGYYDLFKVQRRISELCSVLASVKLEDYGIDEMSMERLVDLYDDLLTGVTSMELSLARLKPRIKGADLRARAAKFRQNTGRTPEETAIYEARADKLEAEALALGG